MGKFSPETIRLQIYDMERELEREQRNVESFDRAMEREDEKCKLEISQACDIRDHAKRDMAVQRAKHDGLAKGLEVRIAQFKAENPDVFGEPEPDGPAEPDPG